MLKPTFDEWNENLLQSKFYFEFIKFIFWNIFIIKNKWKLKKTSYRNIIIKFFGKYDLS